VKLYETDKKIISILQLGGQMFGAVIRLETVAGFFLQSEKPKPHKNSPVSTKNVTFLHKFCSLKSFLSLCSKN
jgi:hypothetical protein